MKVYLIRHGETEENLKKTYYGDMDCGITDVGIKQAQKLNGVLKNIKFDKVFCSEKLRAKQTLQEIYHGEYEIDKRINERNFGIFEGKTYKEIQLTNNKEYDEWINDWKSYPIDGGESFAQFYLRVKNFMEELKSQSYEYVLISTHGGVMGAIYTYIMDENLDLYWKFSTRNGDLSIINCDDGYFYIDSIINMSLF